jgi:hypothetical protein
LNASGAKPPHQVVEIVHPKRQGWRTGVLNAKMKRRAREITGTLSTRKGDKSKL